MGTIDWKRCAEVLPQGDHNTRVICYSNGKQFWTTNAAAIRAVSEIGQWWTLKLQVVKWTYDTPEVREALKNKKIF